VYPRTLEAFAEVVYCDTEFHQPPGELPEPICLVWFAHRARRLGRLWLWGREAPPPPSIFHAPRVLFVAYLASAECSVLHALRWPLPRYVLDLYAEMRNHTNGTRERTFIGLHESAAYWRIPYLDKAHKDRMREIAIAGGPAVEAHRDEMLRYCQDDTLVLVPILERLAPHLSLPHALIRGDFVRDSAGIERRGLPVNAPAYRHLLAHREPLRRAVAQEANAALGPLFDGDHLSEKALARFIQGLGLGKVWPRTPHGRYRKDIEGTLKLFGKRCPPVETLRQTMKTLNDLRDVALAIGRDGRNRYLQGLFGTITSRNNPTKHKEVLLLRSRWWRHFIQPLPGRALAYLDFSSEEFMVMAVLAGDTQGIADYQSGDVYVAWGQTMGLIPASGDKRSHPRERKLLKDVVLGINYGAGPRRLALELGISHEAAGRFIQSYHERYHGMVAYGTRTVEHGVYARRLHTRFDWRLSVHEVIASKREYEEKKKPANVITRNSLRNFPAQSNAAEILRLAVIEATRLGVNIVATLHDAFLIESPEEEIGEHVRLARQAMQVASTAVLGYAPAGDPYVLRVDDTVIRPPDHFRDGETQAWWQQLDTMVQQLSGESLEEVGKPALVVG
jgi:DNA polymerase I